MLRHRGFFVGIGNTGRTEHLYLDEWVRDMKKKRLVNRRTSERRAKPAA